MYMWGKPFKAMPVLVEKSFPGDASGKELAWQGRRHKKRAFDPWVREIPWRRERQPILAFLLGKSHAQSSTEGYIQSMGSQRVDTIEGTDRPHTHTHTHTHTHSVSPETVSRACNWTVACSTREITEASPDRAVGYLENSFFSLRAIRSHGRVLRMGIICQMSSFY